MQDAEVGRVASRLPSAIIDLSASYKPAGPQPENSELMSQS
jgi:hypothetical protein